MTANSHVTQQRLDREAQEASAARLPEVEAKILQSGACSVCRAMFKHSGKAAHQSCYQAIEACLPELQP